MGPKHLRMVSFEAEIEKFGKQGEKTGWSYVLVSQDIAHQIRPATRTSFRVKGFLDDLPIQGIALIPMGEGDFILVLNAQIRKTLKKEKGFKLQVRLQFDNTPFSMDTDFIDCLEEDPPAKSFFQTLSPSHQRYFSKYISEAKTSETKSRRIVQALHGLSMQWDYGKMIREGKRKRKDSW